MTKNSHRLVSVFYGMVIVAVLLAVFFPAAIVSAHANLVRSDPERGAVLAQPPKQITLEFSEALDSGMSVVRLIDSKGQVIVKGPGRMSVSRPTLLTLDLPVLPEGSYSAVWQTHSAKDGHFSNGSIPFSIGKSDPNVSLLPPANTQLPREAIPGPVDIALRWITYLSTTLMGGAIFFGILVWRPAYQKSLVMNPETDRIAATFLKRLVILGASFLLFATLASFLYQAFSAFTDRIQPSFLSALSASLNFLVNWQSWFRVVMLAAVLLITPRLVLPAASPTGIDWWSMGALMVLIFTTISMKSHAAATSGWLPLWMDITHLTAMAAWMGGLLPLFYLLQKTDIEPSILVPHFSRVALSSVVVLSATGLYTAIIQIHTLEALLTTSYGITLLAKLILFGLLIGLGAVNLLVITPRFKNNIAGGKRNIRLILRFELTLSLILLAAVGVLSGALPSFEALQSSLRLGNIGDFTQDGIHMRLWLTPGFTGENQIAVDFSGLSPEEQKDALVLFRFQQLDRDLGITQAQATPDPAGQDRFQVRGSYFTTAGNWQIEVILRRPGVNDIRRIFATEISAVPNGPNSAVPLQGTP